MRTGKITLQSAQSHNDFSSQVKKQNKVSQSNIQKHFDRADDAMNKTKWTCSTNTQKSDVCS